MEQSYDAEAESDRSIFANTIEHATCVWVGVQTVATGIAEIHEMKMDRMLWKTRTLEYLDLLAGKLVEFKHGSFHLMLMDLKSQIKPGDVIALMSIVEGQDKKREIIEVAAKARALNSAEGKV